MISDLEGMVNLEQGCKFLHRPGNHKVVEIRFKNPTAPEGRKNILSKERDHSPAILGLQSATPGIARKRVDS
jgi:hypothetical protein